MYWGVDVGSTYTKLAAIDDEGRLQVTETIHTLVHQADRVREFLHDKPVTRIVATGYGRDTIKSTLGCTAVSEIQAHARGAVHFAPDVRFVLDLGGQDTKVIELAAGQFVDFRMNDKCAAGTGRFLEIAANRLGMSLEEFGVVCAGHDHVVEISSMCVVFAESELVSLIARNEKPENIGAGVHRTVATRLAQMAKRFSLESPIVFSGGGALNPLLVSMLQQEIGLPLTPHPMPQQNGAVGAALISRTLASLPTNGTTNHDQCNAHTH